MYSDIFRCKVKDCPWPNNEDLHRPWCRAIEGHRCWGGYAHQHKPKKGMGGNNPNSKIRAVICRRMSDCVDNGLADEGNVHYRDEDAGDTYIIIRRDPDTIVLNRTIPESEVTPHA